MSILGKYVQHKFRNDTPPQLVVSINNEKAMFPDGSFWFVGNCEVVKG